MSRSALRWASLASFGLIGLHLIAAGRFPGNLWGASAAAFLPLPLAIALFSLAALATVPGVAGRAAEGAARLERARAKFAERHPVAAAVGAGLAAFAVFIALRSRNHFLGDGWFRIGELREGSVNLRSADFGDLLIHRELWRLMSAVGFKDPSWDYALTSALAGSAALLLMPALARELLPERSLRWAVPAFLVGMGSVQLYFGYVECYTLRELAILVYFLLALRALRGGSRLAAAGSLAIACVLHLTLLAFAPSAIILLLARRGEAPRRIAAAGGAFVILALAAVAALHAFGRQYGGLDAILPLRAAAGRAYGLFAAKHIADMGNVLLLVAPGGILLLLASAARRTARRPAARFTWRGLLETETSFWILAAAGPLAMMFLLDPRLGFRDWDLLAVVGAPLTLAGIRLFFGREAAKGRSASASDVAAASNLAAAAFMWCAVSCVHASAWVLVNHDFGRSAEMVRVTAVDDPHHLTGTNPRLVNLAVEFNRQGLHSEAYELEHRAIELAPDGFWGHYNLGTMLLADHRLDEAATQLREAVRADPKDPHGHLQLGAVYGMLSRYGDSVEELRKGVALSPGDGNACFNLGLSELLAGDTASAIRDLETTRRLLPPQADVEEQLTRAYRAAGDWAHAREHAELFARLNPGSFDAHIFLAESLLRLGDRETARGMLEALVANAPNAAGAERARALLGEAVGAGGPAGGVRPGR